MSPKPGSMRRAMDEATVAARVATRTPWGKTLYEAYARQAAAQGLTEPAWNQLEQGARNAWDGLTRLIPVPGVCIEKGGVEGIERRMEEAAAGG